MEQNRFKSKYVWLAIFALVGFILQNWGIYDVIGLTNETYQQLVDLILGVLIALGIVNNPTDKQKW